MAIQRAILCGSGLAGAGGGVSRWQTRGLAALDLVSRAGATRTIGLERPPVLLNRWVVGLDGSERLGVHGGAIRESSTFEKVRQVSHLPIVDMVAFPVKTPERIESLVDHFLNHVLEPSVAVRLKFILRFRDEWTEPGDFYASPRLHALMLEGGREGYAKLAQAMHTLAILRRAESEAVGRFRRGAEVDMDVPIVIYAKQSFGKMSPEKFVDVICKKGVRFAITNHPDSLSILPQYLAQNRLGELYYGHLDALSDLDAGKRQSRRNRTDISHQARSLDLEIRRIHAIPAVHAHKETLVNEAAGLLSALPGFLSRSFDSRSVIKEGILFSVLFQIVQDAKETGGKSLKVLIRITEGSKEVMRNRDLYIKAFSTLPGIYERFLPLSQRLEMAFLMNEALHVESSDWLCDDDGKKGHNKPVDKYLNFLCKLEIASSHYIPQVEELMTRNAFRFPLPPELLAYLEAGRRDFPGLLHEVQSEGLSNFTDSQLLLRYALERLRMDRDAVRATRSRAQAHRTYLGFEATRDPRGWKNGDFAEFLMAYRNYLVSNGQSTEEVDRLIYDFKVMGFQLASTYRREESDVNAQMLGVALAKIDPRFEGFSTWSKDEQLSALQKALLCEEFRGKMSKLDPRDYPDFVVNGASFGHFVDSYRVIADAERVIPGFIEGDIISHFKDRGDVLVTLMWHQLFDLKVKVLWCLVEDGEHIVSGPTEVVAARAMIPAAIRPLIELMDAQSDSGKDSGRFAADGQTARARYLMAKQAETTRTKSGLGNSQFRGTVGGPGIKDGYGQTQSAFYVGDSELTAEKTAQPAGYRKLLRQPFAAHWSTLMPLLGNIARTGKNDAVECQLLFTLGTIAVDTYTSWWRRWGEGFFLLQQKPLAAESSNPNVTRATGRGKTVTDKESLRTIAFVRLHQNCGAYGTINLGFGSSIRMTEEMFHKRARATVGGLVAYAINELDMTLSDAIDLVGEDLVSEHFGTDPVCLSAYLVKPDYHYAEDQPLSDDFGDMTFNLKACIQRHETGKEGIRAIATEICQEQSIVERLRAAYRDPESFPPLRASLKRQLYGVRSHNRAMTDFFVEVMKKDYPPSVQDRLRNVFSEIHAEVERSRALLVQITGEDCSFVPGDAALEMQKVAAILGMSAGFDPLAVVTASNATEPN